MSRFRLEMLQALLIPLSAVPVKVAGKNFQAPVIAGGSYCDPAEPWMVGSQDEAYGREDGNLYRRGCEPLTNSPRSAGCRADATLFRI
jgi:hypothetical protein